MKLFGIMISVISVLSGIVLTVVGCALDGWRGVAVTLSGQVVFIILLGLYNKRHK